MFLCWEEETNREGEFEDRGEGEKRWSKQLEGVGEGGFSVQEEELASDVTDNRNSWGQTRKNKLQPCSHLSAK